MTSLVLDLRIAIRALWKSRAVSTLIVSMLALGLGSTTALFSAVDAVWLKGLPFGEPERLVEIFGQEGERTSMRVPGVIVDALRQRARTLEAITVHAPLRATLRTREGAVALVGERVSARFLEVVHVSPVAGRGFRVDDEQPGAAAVVVVAHGFWQRYLGGDPTRIGEAVSLNDEPHIVIGVMPPSFRTAFRGPEKEYWTPKPSTALRDLEEGTGYELIARLRPGATIDEARREVQAIAVSVGDEPWRTQRRLVGVHGLRDEIVRDSAQSLQVLLAAAVVLLALMCANLAQLLLARSDRRARDFAVRKALGAGAIRLFRLAFLESLLLSVAGGLAGLVLAIGLLPALVALAPSEIPRLADARLDIRVVAASLVLTLLTGGLFGLMPALRLARQSGLSTLHEMRPTASTRRVRTRTVLVVVQVATSVALVSVALLVGRTFLSLLPSDPGFAADARWSFPVALVGDLFTDSADRHRKVQDVLERLRATPGMREVALASNIPFGGNQMSTPVRLVWPQQGDAPRSAGLQAEVRAISQNLFQLLEMPMHRGRAFTQADEQAASPVAIVNRAMAQRLIGDGDVLGHRLRIGAAPEAPTYEIVGVVADARSRGTSTDVSSEVYIPFAASRSPIVHLVVRSSFEEHDVTQAIRAAIRAVLPDLALRCDQTATPLDRLIYQALARPRFSATLMSAFSSIALLLAALGVFGLVAYSVSERQREFGVRVALGAMPLDLLAAAMRSALLVTAGGVAVGLAVALYAARLLRHQLYGIGALDVHIFMMAAVLMLAIGSLSAYVPARRAGRVDALELLRTP